MIAAYSRWSSIDLVPPPASWPHMKVQRSRPQTALHGAAGLLGAMLARGVSREAIERALSSLLDEWEQQLAEDNAMGGPAEGTA